MGQARRTLVQLLEGQSGVAPDDRFAFGDPGGHALKEISQVEVHRIPPPLPTSTVPDRTIYEQRYSSMTSCMWMTPMRPRYSDSRIPECYSHLRCPEGMWGGGTRPHGHERDLEDQGGEPAEAGQSGCLRRRSEPRHRPRHFHGTGTRRSLGRRRRRDGRAGKTGGHHLLRRRRHRGRGRDCAPRRVRRHRRGVGPGRGRPGHCRARADRHSGGQRRRTLDGHDPRHPPQALGALPSGEPHGHVPRHTGRAAVGHGAQARLAHRHHDDGGLPDRARAPMPTGSPRPASSGTTPDWPPKWHRTTSQSIAWLPARWS